MRRYTKTRPPTPPPVDNAGAFGQPPQQRAGGASTSATQLRANNSPNIQMLSPPSYGGRGRTSFDEVVAPPDNPPDDNSAGVDIVRTQNLSTSRDERRGLDDSDASSARGIKAGTSTIGTNIHNLFSSTRLSVRFSPKKAPDQTTDTDSVAERVPFFHKKPWSLPKVVQDVTTEELKETDIVIALMGPTGSGKSSFVSTVAGSDKGIGHGLKSYTSDIHAIRVQFPSENIEIVLVDTPGFDDTEKSDYQILQLISKWLEKAGRKNILLDGILYLHRISDNRMAGTPLRNLDVFKKICGPQACSRVVMMTTMWDELNDDETGEERQVELESTFWKGMLEQGSDTVRYRNTPESAWSILDRFSGGQRQQLAAIRLQKETVKQNKSLPSTDAGQALYDKIEELDKKRKSLMRMLKKHMNKRGTDEEIVAMLRQQYEGLEKEREAALGELQALKIPVPQRLRKSFGMKKRYWNS